MNFAMHLNSFSEWRNALPRPVLEKLIGAVVVTAATLIIVLAYRSSGITVVEGYTVTAKFDRIEGLRVGSDVRLSGIKVGNVLALSLEPKTYRAVLELSIDRGVKLPTDTSAKIVTEGLLGSKYVALVPGAEEALLPPQGEIRHTQSSINLEDLIGRYLSPEPKSQGQRKGGGNPAGA